LAWDFSSNFSRVSVLRHPLEPGSIARYGCP
jgi:hypothetical protein